VAGDLFVKHMDWPGAQELSQRLAKTLDPKLLSDDDKSPEMQAAEMQMQAMAQEMEQLHGMLKGVQQSMESQDLEIKKYDAETKRISAVQAGMSPEQIQDIVMGTIAAALDTGDLIGGNIPARGELMPEMMPPPEMPQ
jgi:predicted transcriptional regulator